MWEMDHKKGWEPKDWCFQILMLEKNLESPLNCKEIKLILPEGKQPWIFIRRTDAEAEALILWPPDRKSQLIGKDPDSGKEWGQEEKRVTEDEMAGWHHWLSGHEFEQLPGDSERKRSLVRGSPWGCKESDTTEQWDSNSGSLVTVLNYRLWRQTAHGSWGCSFRLWDCGQVA